MRLGITNFLIFLVESKNNGFLEPKYSSLFIIFSTISLIVPEKEADIFVRIFLRCSKVVQFNNIICSLSDALNRFSTL